MYVTGLGALNLSERNLLGVQAPRRVAPPSTATTGMTAPKLVDFRAQMPSSSPPVVPSRVTAPLQLSDQTFRLLTPLKTSAGGTVVDVREIAPKPGSGRSAGSIADLAPPSGGSGKTPGTQATFAEACAAAGGSLYGSDVCAFPDGAHISIDVNGTPVCRNMVGKCSTGVPRATAGGGNTAIMIGAAALAALALLR